MPDRNSLLGRSKPSERLTQDEIAALDKATAREAEASASVDVCKAGWEEGWWSVADGRQGPVEISLEPRLPRLRFQGHRRRRAQARAAPGEVRPLQAGPDPGRWVMVRSTSIPLGQRNDSYANQTKGN